MQMVGKDIAEQAGKSLKQWYKILDRRTSKERCIPIQTYLVRQYQVNADMASEITQQYDDLEYRRTRDAAIMLGASVLLFVGAWIYEDYIEPKLIAKSSNLERLVHE